MKLFQFGCSWSDYTGNIKETYGEILAKHYGREYIHEARGCGSNWRYFRLLPQFIHERKIDKEDIILIQITAFERAEVWTGRDYKIIDYRKTQNMTDPWYNHDGVRDGTILRMKAGAEKWFAYPEEKEFAKQRMKFVNNDWDITNWNSHMLSLQGLLDYHGFKNVLWMYTFAGRNIPENKRQRISQVPPMMVRPNNFCGVRGWCRYELTLPGKNDEEHDYTHLNQAGHKYVAGVVQEQLDDILKVVK